MTSVAVENSAAKTPRAVAVQAAALHRDGKFAAAEALLGDAIAAHPGSTRRSERGSTGAQAVAPGLTVRVRT